LDRVFHYLLSRRHYLATLQKLYEINNGPGAFSGLFYMEGKKMEKFTVCLCFGYDKCEQITQETAIRNNADSYEVVPVSAPYGREPAYKGLIIFENKK
jgi:hypothetical protein